MYILKKSFSVNQIDHLPSSNNKYRSRALKSRSKLKAAIGLRAALQNFLLHQNLCLFTVTFGEKVLTLAKSRGP